MVSRDLGWATRFGERRGCSESCVVRGVMDRRLVKNNPILVEGKFCLKKFSYWLPWQETEKSTFWNKYTLHAVEQNTEVKTLCFRGWRGETERTFFCMPKLELSDSMCPTRAVTTDQAKARHAVNTLWGRLESGYAGKGRTLRLATMCCDFKRSDPL